VSAPAPIAEVDAGAVDDEATFRRLVIEPCRPAVLRGLAAGWPATMAGARSPEAAADYLRRFDAGVAAEAFVGEPAIAGRYTYGDGPGGFNFAREPMAFGQALDRIVAGAGDGGRTIYMGSLPADAYLPGFAADNPAPWLPEGVRPRIWIGHASTVACHHDNSDNLACVAAGRRRFTLYPPDAISDLYVGPIDHTMAGQPVSLAAGAPDAGAFPRFAAARPRAVAAELEPGDAIYIPKLWWHQVEASGAFNVLVNFWWDAFPGPERPYTALLLAAAAIAERPAAERAAWRAYFDHYVFRPDDRHPLEHLPAERHGILARGAAGKLRALAMRLLRS
jgi:hypothetical protein